MRILCVRLETGNPAAAPTSQVQWVDHQMAPPFKMALILKYLSPRAITSAYRIFTLLDINDICLLTEASPLHPSPMLRPKSGRAMFLRDLVRSSFE